MTMVVNQMWSARPERVPISTGVGGDQRVAALISVAVVCGDQCDAVLISVGSPR